MPNYQSALYDVVIAGAGPVGLFLACELRLADLSVLVLEQAEDPRSPLKRLPFGMRGLSAPTIEAFYRRGLLDDIAAPQPATVDAAALRSRALDAAAAPSGRPFRRHPVLPRQHRQLEVAVSPAKPGRRQLGGRYGAPRIRLGCCAQARWGSRSGAASASKTSTSRTKSVTIRAGGETFRGRWLVGCDGGRSTVRKAGGFEFVGTDPEFTGYSVEVEMADPDKLPPGPPLHADGHVHLRPTRDDRDGRLRRRRFPPNPADHA